MAINGSSGALLNPHNDFFSNFDLDQQAANQANYNGYSSDFVEDQLGGVGKMPIVFEGEKYNSTPEYLGLTGINIPSYISALPNSLGYIRSAAYSIAESYGQLKSRGEKEYTNDEILEMTMLRVMELFQQEIERISEYMNQENVILMLELEKKFERHLEVLGYYLEVFSNNMGSIKTSNVQQNIKGSSDEILQAA